MTYINDNFLKLPVSYLFSEIAQRVKRYKSEHPDADVIRLGIGDVTQPLCPAVIGAMHRAVDEMAAAESFHGYGPEHGYSFLQEAIIRHDYESRGVSLEKDEIFINDGAKSDLGNIGDIFGLHNTLCMTDPIYPVYVDSNAMSGRAGDPLPGGYWTKIEFLPCNAENNFVPALPESRPSIIYLCYPNNPTGTVISREELEKWVKYALANDSIIMYDSAYEAYIREEDIPHTIYEIDGAKQCAIEFRSYSKTAGFTGVRCGYTIVPKAVTGIASDGHRVELNALWNRRQCTKFNGTSYIQHRAAEAVYSPEGREQIKTTINYYMGNAKVMRDSLTDMGYEVFGGVNAPYIWLKCPDGIGSWDFFDTLLNGPHIVGTPGVGFGPAGEGYIRLTAFGSREDCTEAMERLYRMK